MAGRDTKPWFARSRLVAFLAGGAAALALVGVGALAVVETGAFDAAATKPHSHIVYWATHAAMIHSVRVRALAVTPPASFTPAQVQAGFDAYQDHCVACHGGPGTGHAPWAGGLNPDPPYLLDASQRWRRAELYWIIEHGVKMTAMPSWRNTLSEGQIWDTVAFLEAMPAIPPTAYLAMARAHAAQHPSAAQP